MCAQVVETMKAIRQTLLERHYAWEDAYELSQHDPEVNLNAGPGEPWYTPSSVYDYDEFTPEDDHKENEGPATDLPSPASETTPEEPRQLREKA
jgi:large subunit ribosomal protein L47